MSDKPIDVVIVPENSLLPVTQAAQTEKTDPLAKQQITAAQAKIEAIAELTHSAYQKVGSLQITKEETERLMADFPDEAFKPGAGGKEFLIYIEHAFLRDRFLQVFGMGQWAIVPRRTWSEQFVTGRGTEGVRVYVEAMLVVRGCFVAEAVGSMEYYPKNESQDYGDAVEGAKTAAFRRCAKEFGVGLQAWKKDWCQGWMDRKMAPGKRVYPPSKPKPQPAPTPEKPKLATESTREWFIKELGPDRVQATQFAIDLGWLLPTEALEDLELRFVPTSRKQYDSFKECLLLWAKDGKVNNPYLPGPIPPPEDDPHGTSSPPEEDGTVSDFDQPDAPWRAFPVPFGRNAGVALADLEKNTLFGFWANYTVETEYNGKPKQAGTIAKDTIFRQMLDEAGKHYKFTKKD